MLHNKEVRKVCKLFYMELKAGMAGWGWVSQKDMWLGLEPKKCGRKVLITHFSLWNIIRFYIKYSICELNENFLLMLWVVSTSSFFEELFFPGGDFSQFIWAFRVSSRSCFVTVLLFKELTSFSLVFPLHPDVCRKNWIFHRKSFCLIQHKKRFEELCSSLIIMLCFLSLFSFICYSYVLN